LPDAETASPLADLTHSIAAMPRAEGRRLVAVVGAPASGKTVLAGTLTEALNEVGRVARTIPMDGFHLDNRLLDARGLRSRKGAPETFDAAGFTALMQRIKKGGEVVYPVFDRARDLAIAGAAVIEASCDVAIVEGNYLLLDEVPWRALASLWDLSVWIHTPENVLLERCVQRWLDHGHTPEAARARAEGNDLVNARRIIRNSLPADVTLAE
jgi:fructokinase